MSIPIIGTAIYHMKVCKPNIEYYLTENAIFNPFHIPSKLVDAYYESAHRGFGNGKYLMASLDGFYLNVNIQRALQNLSNEITILYGKNVENGKETAESYREINSSISIKSLSDTKLLPQLEMPEEMYKQIEHILK